MRKIGFYFSKYEVDEGEETKLSVVLQEFLQTTTSLTSLTCYIRSGTQELKEDLDVLRESIRSCNLALKTRLEVVVPRNARKC